MSDVRGVREVVDADDEVGARMLLTCATPAGHDVVHQRIEKVGACQTLDEIASGLSPLRGADGWLPRLSGLDVSRMRERLDRIGGRVIAPGSIEWSTQLDDLTVPPLLLWVRGHVDVRVAALRSVAIVGSRACTTYGQHVGTSLSFDLGELGWNVVSGGAYGVDAAAHKGCMASGAPTIAVLACGVDQAYPSGNAGMFERIAAQGALVSEVPLGAHPTRFGFRVRNRVIAALARAVVVVEATAGSGSLITAKEALPLRRPVFAVPGPVTSAMSLGLMHEAIAHNKAVDAVIDERHVERPRWRFCVSAADVIDEIGNLEERMRAESLSRTHRADETAPPKSPRPQPHRPDHPDQARVIEAMSAVATPVESLAVACGLTPRVTLAALGQLAVGAHVVRDTGGWRLADGEIRARGMRRPRAARGGP